MVKLTTSQILKIAIATLTTSLLSGSAFHFGTDDSSTTLIKIPASVNTLYSKWIQKYSKVSDTPAEHLYRLK